MKGPQAQPATAVPHASHSIRLDSGARSTVDTCRTMPECCSPGPSTSDAGGPVACVACRTAAKPVDSLTVKALLTESALNRFEPAQYRFCPDPNCDLVYFGEGAPTFLKSDLRVPVWQKEPPGRRTICYCFGENEGDIAAEIDRTGESLAVYRVRTHIAAGRCACEVRNPKGACCLGDVTAAVEHMRQVAAKGALRP